MAKIRLTESAFRSVMDNLREIEDRKAQIMEENYLKNTRENQVIVLLLNNYLQLMRKTVSSIVIDPNSDNEFPFVAIGCQVTIEDLSNSNIFCYKIIPPFSENIEIDQVSIFSPLGKALLMKQRGESICIQAPGGKFWYKILSISYW